MRESSALSRREQLRHDGPYRAAIVPLIAKVRPLLPSELVTLVETASAEVARFDEQMGGELAPFSSILLRSESAASSRIENLTASARAIAEAELGTSGRKHAAEIVANTRTMTAALALADDIRASSILAMHHALMHASDPVSAGRWRTEQVWIGGGHAGPHLATFVPPQHARVASAIDDLVAFIRRDDLPVLAHAALAHAQFETIHPFTDGNGRTGRALVQAMLRHGRLTRSVTVPVSAGLLANTQAYFDALTKYRAGDPGAIVRLFAHAAFRAVDNGRSLVTELRRLRAQWQQTVHARRDSSAWRVADLLLRRPVVNARLVADELELAVGNVHRYVKPLLDGGVLIESSDAKRNQVWRAPDVLAALDAFAARTGRRTP
ncbi:MAG: Fic family protein [Myxococcales bacterium]|nr:Fic family protein [Myxococcales bacterium]